MDKSQLVDAVAKNTDIEQASVGRVVDGILSAIIHALSHGDEVEILGFGVFKAQERKERISKNPKTGAPLKISAKRIPRFAPGTGFKLSLNTKA